MSASLLDQAIRFLEERGWPMLPSKGPQKKPCVGWKKFQEQLPTVEQLREWDRKFKPERWGPVTGRLAGIVVVDFDGDQGIELMKKWGSNPHVRTGSGGFHIYVQHPGWRVPTLNAKTSKNSWPWPGLDIRGDGGFAVLLGRNSSGPYEQLRELIPEPFDVLPEEVRNFLNKHDEKDERTPQATVRTWRNAIDVGSRPDSETLIRKALEAASRSGRNNAGFWLACQLRDNGFSEVESDAAMRDYISRVGPTNMKGQREPYTVAEAMASLREAYSKPARAPWAIRKRHPHDDCGPAPAPSRQRRGDNDAPPEKLQPPQPDDADDSGSIHLYVGHTGEPLVGHMGEPLDRSKFARVPREVSGDRRLKHRDVRIYGVLAGFCWQGSVAKVGKRLLSRLARCAERLVIDSLKKLEITGHIQKAPDRRRGQRAWYILTSPVFGQKQRAGVDEVAIIPGGRPRLVSVRKDQKTAWTSSRQPQSAPPKRSGRP
jgi:hypothetical protein